MKNLRGAADLLASLARRQGGVTTVTFQVTDRCNYECVHCYQEHDAHDDELSFAEIDRILGELADAGVLFLTLLGGEFFMRRDADEILARAHALGFAIKLKSTGHHITDKRADFLATLRPLQVDLSLYAASRHVHEDVTRSPGSHERTLAAARRLLARRVPVKLNIPVMESNAGEIAELERLADELGATHSFDPKITVMENADLAPATRRMSREALLGFYRESIADEIAGIYAKPGADPSKHRPLAHTPCRAGQQAVAINPRGEVWPCILLPIKSGDLRVDSFRSIYTKSTQLDEVRHLTWATLGECAVCPVRAYCNRCHAMAMLEHGEIRGPSLEACRHAVAIRDSLRDGGHIPATDTEMPPTWDRVDPDGQHHQRDKRRPPALRVVV